MRRPSFVLVLVYIYRIHSSLQALDKQFGGAFIIDFQRFEPCEDQGSGEITFDPPHLIRVSRKDVVYTGVIETLVPIDDNFTFQNDVALWGNGGWRENYMNLRFKHVCEYVKLKFPKFFQKAITFTNVTDCPIPQGRYEVTNLTTGVEPGKQYPQQLPYVKTKNTMSLWYNDQKIACFHCYVDTKPRPVRPKKQKSKS